MKIGLLQTDICWNDVKKNIVQIESFLEGSEPADVYVLPEMWATGFDMNPAEETQTAAERALVWMKETAAGRNCCLSGSLAVEEGGIFRNRHYWVRADGSVAWYDKRHLFSPGFENKHYAAGSERVVVEHLGVRFLLQTCYDLRFPVFSRNMGDYDVALYVANWPEVRQHAWEVLLQARAIENQCYVCGVNRTGFGDGITYAGGSVLVSPYGQELVKLSHHAGLVVGEVDLLSLARFRQKFPVLQDADHFSLA